ncbi:hypothetical protein DX901_07745 [Serratia odorifera]|nr:hypothetical protein DX901_07745 [Serratia odorifera]
MATTDDDDVKLIWIKHGTAPRRIANDRYLPGVGILLKFRRSTKWCGSSVIKRRSFLFKDLFIRSLIRIAILCG